MRFWVLAAVWGLAAGVPVRADVTVVAAIHVKGDNPGEENEPKNYIQTMYYKGAKRRIEEKGKVRIANGDEGKEYTLDPKKKTFTVETISASDPPSESRSKTGGTVTYGDKSKAAEALGIRVEYASKPIQGKKMIRGKSARGVRYRIALILPKLTETSPKPASKNSKGATNDFAEQMAKAMLSVFPNMVLSGEQWLTDEIAVPKSLPGEALLASLLNNEVFRSAVTENERRKMQSEMTGLALSGVVHFKITFPKSRQNKDPDRPQNVEVTYSRDVTSISEAALDDALFTIPADYTLIKTDSKGP